MSLSLLWERNSSRFRCREVVDDLSRCLAVCGGLEAEWDAGPSAAAGALPAPHRTRVSQALARLAQGKAQPSVGVFPK